MPFNSFDRPYKLHNAIVYTIQVVEDYPLCALIFKPHAVHSLQVLLSLLNCFFYSLTLFLPLPCPFFCLFLLSIFLSKSSG